MCAKTTYRTYGAGASSYYKHVAPLEQKHAFWCCVLLLFNQTYVINQFLISNSRYNSK